MPVKNYTPYFLKDFIFISNMCGRVRASNDLKEFSVVSNYEIKNYNYFSPNSETFINAIIFKTDRIKPFTFEHKIRPHVLNYENENYAVFFLKNPVRLDKNKEKTGKIEILLNLAFELLFKVYGVGEKPETFFVLMPNPAKNNVEIFYSDEILFDLNDIVNCFYNDYSKKIKNVKSELTDTKPKEEKTLFNQLRWWCYRTKEQDRSNILLRAVQINIELKKPFKQDKVIRISDAVADFMETKYKMKPKRSKEQIKKILSECATETNEKRQENKKNFLLKKVSEMQDQGLKISKKSLTAFAGVSMHTVIKYWTEIF